MEIGVYILTATEVEEAPGIKYEVTHAASEGIAELIQELITFQKDSSNQGRFIGVYNAAEEAYEEALRLNRNAWVSYTDHQRPEDGDEEEAEEDCTPSQFSMEKFPSKLIWLSLPRKIFLARRKPKDKQSSACLFITQDLANKFIADSTDKCTYTLHAEDSEELYERWVKLFKLSIHD